MRVNMQKKKILFGAGVAGQIAMHYFGEKNIHCFVDNHKHGQNLNGKKIISFNELLLIYNEYDVIITANYIISKVLTEQCRHHNINAEIWDKMISWRDYERNDEIYKFKDIHLGERCFLLGNGPSLTATDLDKLQENNIVSIGCNKIYNIFPYTSWRPQYYVVADTAMIQLQYAEFSEIEVETKFIQNPNQIFYSDNEKIESTLKNGYGSTFFYNKIISSMHNNNVSFSEDISRAIYMSGSVMFPMLQIAVFMGFNEIYLLGVDNTPKSMNDIKEYSTTGHFYTEDTLENERYVALRGVVDIDIALELLNNDYNVTKEYCTKRGIKIFNATRGGKLEVFDRVNFDFFLE